MFFHVVYFRCMLHHLTVTADLNLPFCIQYDTGQISDILLMPDFLQRFATCTDPSDSSTCAFSTVREGLIVGLLSIGTLIGALVGAP